MTLFCSYCRFLLHPVYEPTLDHVEMVQCFNSLCPHQSILSVNTNNNDIIYYKLCVGPSQSHIIAGAQITNYTQLHQSTNSIIVFNKNLLVTTTFIPLSLPNYQQQAEKVFHKLLKLVPFS